MLHSTWPAAVRSLAVPGHDLAARAASSTQRGKCPRWLNLLVFTCAQACCLSSGSCQGQDLQQGGHKEARGDMYDTRAHLEGNCSFGNLLVTLPKPQRDLNLAPWGQGQVSLTQ